VFSACAAHEIVTLGAVDSVAVPISTRASARGVQGHQPFRLFRLGFFVKKRGAAGFAAASLLGKRVPNLVGKDATGLHGY
jgi:hypothetical protein